MHLFANISPDAPVFGVLFAEGFGSLLIFLAIAGISSFFQSLKKKGEKNDDWTKESPPPAYPTTRPTAPPKPRPAVDWEAELRRMLGEEQPAPRRPSPPPIAPPPVIPVSTKRANTPPPLSPAPRRQPSMAVPKVFTQPRIYKAHCDHCDGHLEFPAELLGESFVCPHCFEHTVLQPFGETRVEKLQHQPELAHLKESATALQRAQHMDERVASRLEAVSHTPVGLTQAQGARKRSAEIEQVAALLHTPKTARQVVIASFILGTPKALEN